MSSSSIRMTKTLKQKFIVYRPDRRKYLVYKNDEPSPNAWNSRMSWTSHKIYARRFNSKEYAVWAMKLYQTYTKVDQAYLVQEIWE